ncbi:MAG: hypothetical protein U0Y08_00535 [Bacteroidia bacterium]
MSIKSIFIKLTGGNKQAATFLMFVLLSAVIWSVNALSKEHVTSFEIPIRYLQNLSGTPDQSLPTRLNITVKGKGFYLMRLSSALRGFSIVPKSMSVPGRDTVISALDAMAPVLENFIGKLEITSYSPEQLLLSGRQMYSKKVAIKANCRLSFKPAYVPAGPSVIQPDSILLFSSSPVPDSLNALYTAPFTISNIEAGVFKPVKPELPGPGYHLAATSFLFYLPVEKATEISLDVPIRNSNKAMNEQYLPSSVKLTCRVPLSKFKLTRPELFLVTTGDTSISGDRVLVRIAHAPYWASSVTIEPSLVNRILKAGY